MKKCTPTQRPQSSVTMDRIWLGVLYISGWHISTCLSHQYHFVADAKNWTDAQIYCNQTYKDLATIQNTDELNDFISTLSSAGYNYEVWIGLYNEIDWMWSDGYTGTGADYKIWEPTEPNFYSGSQFCVATEINGLWYDYSCSTYYPFVCYNGTQKNPQLIFVNAPMDWSSAQSYCRQNYIDLATVTSDGENQQLVISVQNISSAWIGLYRNPNLFWSDGSSFFYSNFRSGPNYIRSMTVTCGYATLSSLGKWKFWPCETVLPFVCYNDPPALHRQVLKLMINLNPALELNNLTVKEDLLKMFQDRLKAKGVSEVTLKWREQPDGKVFHEEDYLTQNTLSEPTC